MLDGKEDIVKYINQNPPVKKYLKDSSYHLLAYLLQKWNKFHHVARMHWNWKDILRKCFKGRDIYGGRAVGSRKKVVGNLKVEENLP